MPRPSDLWYVRFPDGRVVRAANSAVVRQHLGTGRIPPGSRLRRSSEDEWRAIERISEFSASDGSPERRIGTTPPPPTLSGHIANRVDPGQLHQVGVRGIVEELLAALDATLSTRKLLVCLFAGLFLGGLLALSQVPVIQEAGIQPYFAGLTLACILAQAVVLTRMTYVELSRLRPARWGDGLANAGFNLSRLALSQGLLGVLLAILIALLRLSPTWIGELDSSGGWGVARDILTHGAVVLGILLEVILLPLLALLLPLGPLLVIESCSVASGIGQWLGMVRRQAGRILICQLLALAMGLLVLAPLVVPGLLVFLLQPEERFPLTACLTRDVLVGIAAGGLLGFLQVANVFIYLELRYETGRR